MIIKSFTAESAAAALKKIRSDMGGDAIVLKTISTGGDRGQKLIEVTACLDKASVGDTSRILSRPQPEMVATAATPKVFAESNGAVAESQSAVRAALAEAITEKPEVPMVPESPEAQEEPDLAAEAKSNKTESSDSPIVSTNNKGAADSDILSHSLSKMFEKRFANLEKKFVRLADSIAADINESAPNVRLLTAIRSRLLNCDLPEDFVDAFVTSMEVETIDVELTLELTEKNLRQTLQDMTSEAPKLKHGDRVLFLGPVGSGKTTVMGKLAAELIGRDRKKVRLVSVDDVKIGAHDEIINYAAILGIDTGQTQAVGEDSADSDAITLIDSPAMPNDPEKRTKLIARLQRVGPTHKVAVFSALTRSADLMSMAQSMQQFKPDHLALTMLDLTERHGGIVAAAEALNTQVAYLSHSPGGVGRLSSPNATALASHFIGKAEDYE
ncbi:MAG: hypothetical protein V3T31_05295 [candidate division Zixibacteria bacterium]